MPDTVKIVARANYSTPYERISEEEYDPEEHTLWENRDEAEPSDQLRDILSTRQANALAEAGITSLEEAMAYDGDLTDVNGVGDGTVDDLLDAAEA